MSRNLRWLALLLPLVAIVVAIARAELFVRHAQEFTLAIAGYDPRDLLKGRYIQFTIALADDASRACSSAEPACCLCVTRQSHGGAARIARAGCARAQASCDAWLPIERASKPYRFYVPESKATQIEHELLQALRAGDAFAVFAIERDGEARVRALRLRGRSYGADGASR